MSLFTGLQLPSSDQKLAGLIVLSGYLPGAKKFSLTSGLESTPVHHFHGTSDPVVRFEWAEKTQKGLVGKGLIQYNVKTYPGMGHSISPSELNDVKAVISSLLPNDPLFLVKPKDPKDMTVKELLRTIRDLGLGAKASGLCEKHEFVAVLTDYYASKN
jgi:fermentation-respiration switch protein FrsA (DUF1100 family)